MEVNVVKREGREDYIVTSSLLWSFLPGREMKLVWKISFLTSINHLTQDFLSLIYVERQNKGKEME